MSDLSEHLAKLTPDQRELLRKQINKRQTIERQADTAPAVATSEIASVAGEGKAIASHAGTAFSLFFFSADGDINSSEKYGDLFEYARFADERGFEAIWTPERHFHQFGGLYSSPAILSAALAVATRRIKIRAGSVVAPLHHPVRLAEEWCVVDNLSQGRIGVSFASGWHPSDFVLRPEAYKERRKLVFEHIDIIRRLWAKETVSFPNGEGHPVPVNLFPRPIQKELPVWVTSSGTAETWQAAAEMGANILTALLGQNLEELSRKISLYRNTFRERHAGRPPGIVTIMLHAYIGEDIDSVRAVVKKPFCNYLHTHLALYETLIRQTAPDIDVNQFTESDRDALIELAFERYFNKAALIGTPATCRAMVNELISAGVDEIACLIDFGVEAMRVREMLERLDELRRSFAFQLADTVAQ